MIAFKVNPDIFKSEVTEGTTGMRDKKLYMQNNN